MSAKRSAFTKNQRREQGFKQKYLAAQEELNEIKVELAAAADVLETALRLNMPFPREAAQARLAGFKTRLPQRRSLRKPGWQFCTVWIGLKVDPVSRPGSSPSLPTKRRRAAGGRSVKSLIQIWEKHRQSLRTGSMIHLQRIGPTIGGAALHLFPGMIFPKIYSFPARL